MTNDEHDDDWQGGPVGGDVVPDFWSSSGTTYYTSL